MRRCKWIYLQRLCFYDNPRNQYLQKCIQRIKPPYVVAEPCNAH